jgi:hypothetical protein
MGFEPEEEVAGLKAKVSEKIGSEKKLRDEMEKMKSLLDKIDLDEYEELKSKASGKGQSSEDTEKLKKLIKKLEEDKLISDSKASKSTETLKTVLREKAVVEALTAAGFSSKKIPLLKDAFLGKTSVELSEDGSAEILINHGDGLGQSPKEFFAKLAKTDEFKDLVENGNTGAGSHRSGGSGTSKVITQAEYNALGNKGMVAHLSSGGKVEG